MFREKSYAGEFKQKVIERMLNEGFFAKPHENMVLITRR